MNNHIYTVISYRPEEVDYRDSEQICSGQLEHFVTRDRDWVVSRIASDIYSNKYGGRNSGTWDTDIYIDGVSFSPNREYSLSCISDDFTHEQHTELEKHFKDIIKDAATEVCRKRDEFLRKQEEKAAKEAKAKEELRAIATKAKEEKERQTYLELKAKYGDL